MSNSTIKTSHPYLRLRHLWLSLLMLLVGTNSTLAQNVAKVGTTEYATLQAAFNAATDGQTVTLLKDYDATGEYPFTAPNNNKTRNLGILNSITFDGANHTLTVKGNGIWVGGGSSIADVTIKDVTIKNSSASGRCIDTRGNIGSLTFNGVTLSTDGAPSGYTQPLTIGGNQANAATVNITNSTIQTNEAGTAYYAIITFNPVNMTISNSTLKGWACIYAKGKVSSAGSAGSTFIIDNSNIVSNNPYSGESNSFAAFVMEDDNVTIDITNSDLKIVNTGDQYQTIAGSSNGLTNDKVNLGEGNTITFVEPGQYALKSGSVEVNIEGGTYNVQLPDEILPEGYICVNNGDGTFTVKQGAWVAKIGDVKYETLEAAFAAVNDGETITMLDDVTLSGNLELALEGKSVTLDLGAKTLNGRTNLKSGNLTVTNGTVNCEGGQPLNVYGSATAGAENYSVLTIADDVTVSGDYGVCMFGPTASSKAGYGAVVNIAGTLNGTKGTVFVSGNLGNNIAGDMNNVVNITGKVNGNSDAGVALNGNATVNVKSGAEITGNTGIAIKRGVLNVEEGATIHATGAENLTPGANNNGTEMTGAAISMTDTYNNYGAMAVNITGGTITSDNTVALFKEEGNYANAATYTVSGGTFNSPVPEEFCADGYIPTNLGDGKYSVKVGAYVAKIGDVKYETLAEAVAAANEGETIEVIVAGDYTLPNLPKNVTIEGKADGVVSFTYTTGNSSIASVRNGATFKNVTFNWGDVNYHGFQEAGTINMENCKHNGRFFSYGNMNFTNCEFEYSGNEYCMWVYDKGEVVYDQCTFTNNTKGKLLHLYCEGTNLQHKVTVKDCKFVNGGELSKSAVNVKATSTNGALQYELHLEGNNTYEGEFPTAVGEQANADHTWILSPLAQVDDRSVDPDKIKVWADDVLIYPVAYVAKIGTQKYVTLEAAFAAVNDGETITMLDDVTLSGNLELALEGKSVTLDLGAKTLNGRTNLKSGNLTVTNGTVNCEGGQPLNVYGSATAGAENYSVLTIANDVTVSGDYGVCMFGPTASSKAGYGAVVNIAGTLNGTKGTVFVSGNLGNNIAGDMNNVVNITGKVNGNSDAGVALNGNATVNVKSGAEITGNTGIAIKRGVLNVEEGATIHATGAENLTPGANNNGTEMTGAAISMTDTYNNYGAMAVNITGGTITSDNTVALFKEEGTYANAATYTISGGTFNSPVPEEFCAEGYIPTNLGDGKYSVKVGEYVAKIGDVKYETLQDALDAAEADDIEDIVIDLLGNASLDITAWSGTTNPLSIGTVNTKSITINGNDKTLTFNQKNSDWNNIATMNDDVTKLVLNNMAITSSGHNDGPWNRHDLNFSCAVELNNVTSDKAFAFKNDATLKNVTVTDESGSLYGIWVQPNGQNISIDGLNVTAERGIKIDDQYVDEPQQVTMSIANATFNTTKKSAILVKSAANTVITAGEGIIIANVAADKDNLVWVDEDRAEEFYKVTVNNATIMPESKETDYVACLMNGEQRWGFYKGTSALSKAIDKVEDGYSIKLFQTTAEAVEVSKPLVITKNGYTADNVTAADGFVREETETEIIIRELDPVAKIGDVTYKTLQKALDAAHEMTGDVTVELIANIEGYSIVHQKAGLNLTIDGAEKTVNGQIIIDGDGRSTGTETLSIKNIVFEDNGTNFLEGTDAFVLVPSTKDTGKPYTTGKYNYAHNVTISDCSFNSTTDAFKLVGFKSTSGATCYNLTMNNVTGNNLHSFAQLTATEGATFDNCSATLTGSFIGANGGGRTYTISNCTFESHPDKADGYAYREKSNSSAVATLTNNNFKAHDAIILGSAGTINVESGTYVGEISKTAGTIVISGGHFSAMVGNPEYDQFIAEGKAGVNGLYPEDENAPNGIGAAVATVTDTEGNVRSFASLKSAFDAAEDGATITLLVDVNENVAVSGEKSVVLDLNEKTLTGYIDQYDTNLNVKNGTIAGTVYVNGGATETDSYNHFTLDASATITSDYGIILYQAEGTKAGYGSTIDINGTVNGMVWVMGNIENGNSVINVNSGAKIKGDVGVALNGMATVNVKEGATIEGSEVGIEARAGNLNVEGGNIKSTAASYSVNPNGSGTTTTGAAIAVAQHTTKLATNVVISGGTLTGVKTISVADPQGNNLEGVTVKAKDELVAANTVIPQDYKWLSDGAGMSTLVPCVYVAQIGDVKYESLADAVAAVPTDGTETTITMIADETVKGNSGVTIATTQNVKLDLNGKTVKLSVTESKGSQLITNRGTLTITDSSDGQTGKLTNEADESLAVGSWPTNNYVTNVITNSGTLNMEAGTVVNTANGSICYAIDNNSTSYDAILNVKGGTLTAVGTVIRQFCNSTTKQNVINMTGGLVTTEGSAAIWVQLPNSDATKAVKAELNVSGGTITGRNYAFYDYSYGNSFDATQYNLSGGTFNGDIFSYGANINITDGTYNGEVAIKQTKPSVVTVSGGKFAGDVYTYGDNASEGFITGGVYAINTYDYEGTTYDCDWTQLLADGYVATENLDPETMAEYPYTVAPMTDQEYVLIDGEPSYKYARLGNVYASKVTYKRSFRNNQIGKYMPWYLPVDYTITGEEDAVFYKIDFIAAATETGVIEDQNKVYIFTVKLNAGEVLKANRPYFIIPNSAGNYVFVSEDVTLYKRIEEPDSRLHLAKSTINYDFYGNYETKIAEAAHEWLMMTGGYITWTDGPGASLGSYRWYIKPSPTDTNIDYTKIRIDIAGDEDVVGISTQVVDDSEIEGYYSVNGTKLAVPVQGTNIVKYKNGMTKKIYIK